MCTTGRYTTVIMWCLNEKSLSLPSWHGPLTRYVKLRIAHAPGMPGTFSPTADFKGNRYLAIPACITARASRTCRDACRDRLPAVAGKTFQAFPARAHPQFYVSGKRPMKFSNDGQFVCYIHRSWATANGIHPSWHWIACFIYHTFAFIDFEEDVDLGFVKYLVPRQ